MRKISRKDILILLGITAFLFTGFICSARGTQEEAESEDEVIEVNSGDSPLVDKAPGTIYDSSNFVVNEDRTVTDTATGLMWSQDDSGKAMNRETALAYAENSIYAGYDDWRLPDIRELESIINYSEVFRTPDTSKFKISEITDEAGNKDYPCFWTSPSNPESDPQDEDSHLYVRLVRGGNAAKTPNGAHPAVNKEQKASIEDGENTDRQQGPPQGRPDFAAAAEKLGITEKALLEALGEPGQGPPDFAAAAEILGISEAELLKALGAPENGMPPRPRTVRREN